MIRSSVAEHSCFAGKVVSWNELHWKCLDSPLVKLNVDESHRNNCMGIGVGFGEHTRSWMGGFSKSIPNGGLDRQSFFRLKKVYRMLGSMGIDKIFARLIVENPLKPFN